MTASASVIVTRAAVVAESRTWLGTPFHHAARLKGVGVDCAQFLIGVYSAVGLVEPLDVGYYAPDWFRHQDGERFLGWVERSCVATDTPQPGDLALFRYGRAVSHGAIVVEWPHDASDQCRVIHSFRGAGVIEEECGLGTALRSRYVGAWRFPCLA